MCPDFSEETLWFDSHKRPPSLRILGGRLRKVQLYHIDHYCQKKITTVGIIATLRHFVPSMSKCRL